MAVCLGTARASCREYMDAVVPSVPCVVCEAVNDSDASNDSEEIVVAVASLEPFRAFRLPQPAAGSRHVTRSVRRYDMTR